MRWRWVFTILAVLSCFSGVPLATAKDKSFYETFEKIADEFLYFIKGKDKQIQCLSNLAYSCFAYYRMWFHSLCVALMVKRSIYFGEVFPNKDIMLMI